MLVGLPAGFVALGAGFLRLVGSDDPLRQTLYWIAIGALIVLSRGFGDRDDCGAADPQGTGGVTFQMVGALVRACSGVGRVMLGSSGASMTCDDGDRLVATTDAHGRECATSITGTQVWSRMGRGAEYHLSVQHPQWSWISTQLAAAHDELWLDR